jgi:hypothetical protein
MSDFPGLSATKASALDLLANAHGVRSPRRTAMSGRSEPLTGIDAGERAPPKASAAENPQLRRLAPAPIFVVRGVLWP